ncbi:MAG: Ig-like domain repeat protein [Dokdonella sp.]|uniref:Ig-like domain repeat protein n=1 Tax=Dokdonella sp. TaxID=2291710 RepID=UPI0032635698
MDISRLHRGQAADARALPVRLFCVLIVFGFIGAASRTSASGFVSAGSMHSARYSHTATLLPSGKVLVVGGIGNFNPIHLKTTELYDPDSNSWSDAAPMTSGRYSHTAVLLPSGKVLIVGGYNGGIFQVGAMLYDPASNSWSIAGNVTSVGGVYTATLLSSGRVFVVGRGSDDVRDEIYDPETGTWTFLGTVPGSVGVGNSFLLPSGRVLSIGSSKTGVYDPALNSWAISATRSETIDNFSASMLQSGDVLVAGGNDSAGFVTHSVALFQPDADAWVQADGLGTHRSLFTATTLASGKVIAIGGYDPDQTWGRLKSAEQYDAQTGLWVPAGAMATERLRHTATLLTSGKILVTGGSDHFGSIADAELYDPTTAVSIVSTTPAATVAGQIYAINVRVSGPSGTPTGTIAIADDLGATCGPVALSAGTAACSIRSTGVGLRTITATYAPADGAFVTGSATAAHAVSSAATETSGIATPSVAVWGQDVVYTAQVSVAFPGTGDPTGSVVMTDGNRSCTALVSDGAANCSFAPSVYGNYVVSLSYLGDENFSPSASSAQGALTEAQTSVEMLPVSPSTVVVGQPATLSSDVLVVSPGGGPATGTVSMDNGQVGCSGVVDANGHATCVARFTSAGLTVVHASYNGDVHRFFPSSSGDVQLVVNNADTMTSITTQSPSASVAGEPVTFGFSTSAVAPSAGIPIGRVTVTDGTQSCIGALDAAGQGTCVIALTGAGSHTLVASFSGGMSGYSGSTSASVDHVVNPSATTLAIVSHAPDPSTPEKSVAVVSVLTATSAGTPTGSITVTDGVDTCTIVQGGQGCAITLTTRGPRTVTATYAGDANFSSSTTHVLHHVNLLPVASAASYEMNEDTELQVQPAQGLVAHAGDADGDPLTLVNPGAITAQGIGGTVVLSADGSFTYTPPTNANGTATFGYTVSDGHESITATATVNVAAVNDPPVSSIGPVPTWPAGAIGTRTQAGFGEVSSFGPPDEADQQVAAWHVRAISDPEGVASNVGIAIDGSLMYVLSGHAGTATFGASLQDDGGTAHGGNDTSSEQMFTITVEAGLDLSIAISDGVDFAQGGSIVVYTIGVRNDGPNGAVGARVQEILPSNLTGATWSCIGNAGAICTAAGEGAIDDAVTIPSGGSLTYVLAASVGPNPEMPLVNAVSVTAPAGVPDTNAGNDTATDTDAVGIFADGFDRTGIADPGVAKDGERFGDHWLHLTKAQTSGAPWRIVLAYLDRNTT